VTAGGLHVVFADVQQQAADLRLAGAPEVARRHRHPREGVVAVQRLVVRDDLAELDGEGVERAGELAAREHHRGGGATGLPAPHAGRAGAEIRQIERGDERETGRGGDRRRVGDEGFEPRAEHCLQVVEHHHRGRTGRSRHTASLHGCPRVRGRAAG
jgi:hypothetical protein